MQQATEGKTRAGKRRIEARAHAQFGALTAREIALFNFAAGVGYRRGYFAQRRREKGQAA